MVDLWRCPICEAAVYTLFEARDGHEFCKFFLEEQAKYQKTVDQRGCWKSRTGKWWPEDTSPGWENVVRLLEDVAWRLIP